MAKLPPLFLFELLWLDVYVSHLRNKDTNLDTFPRTRLILTVAVIYTHLLNCQSSTRETVLAGQLDNRGSVVDALLIFINFLETNIVEKIITILRIYFWFTKSWTQE